MHRTSRAIVLAAALLGVVVARHARAEEATGERAPDPAVVLEPSHPSRPAMPAFSGWMPYRSMLAVASVDPDGLDTQYLFGWKKKLSVSDSVLLRDSYAIVGIAPKVNPSFSRVGASLEIQPIAVFRLFANAEAVQYYATFGNLQSYATPTVDYSDRARHSIAGSAYAAHAFHATVEPMLQAKAGPVAARVKMTAEYWKASLRSGDTVFYASNTDILAPNGGFVLTGTGDMLFVPGNGWVLGARITETQALYRPSDFAPGEDVHARPNGHRQAGVLAAYSSPRSIGVMGKPTFFLLAGWYLESRYRAADATARATPNLVTGISFEY